MKSGTGPTILDRRDASFNRTFGTVSPVELPFEYNVDSGLSMPSQDQDGNPFSCTAYGVTDCGADQDSTVYAPEYTYMKTLFMQGLPPTTQGSDIRPALKSARVYGLLPKDKVPLLLSGKPVQDTAVISNWPADCDFEAGKLEHRKGMYFNVYDDGGMDWFDSFRSALWLNRADKRSIILGTPWFHEWATPSAGVVSSKFTYDGNPENYGWHCWNIKGWKIINGTTYLIGKSWQGKEYGDGGWCYLDRTTINRVMDIRGCVGFTLADATGADIDTIKIGIYETVLYYLYKLLALNRYA